LFAGIEVSLVLVWCADGSGINEPGEVIELSGRVLKEVSGVPEKSMKKCPDFSLKTGGESDYC
jgi:hypothetical protein